MFIPPTILQFSPPVSPAGVPHIEQPPLAPRPVLPAGQVDAEIRIRPDGADLGMQILYVYYTGDNFGLHVQAALLKFKPDMQKTTIIAVPKGLRGMVPRVLKPVR
jgi:hypothetical protein